MKKLWFVLLPVLLLSSCATMDKAYLSNPSSRLTLDTPSLKLGYDVFMVRCDLRRAMHKEFQTGAGSGTDYIEVPNAYSPLVVDFNNGIILDANGNLCIDIIRLYGLDKADSFTLTERGYSFGARTKIIRKIGDKYQIVGRTGGNSLEEGTLKPNGAQDNKGTLSITLDKTKINLVDKQLMGMTTRSEMSIPSENQVQLPVLFGNTTYTLDPDNTFKLDTRYTVSFKSDRILLGSDTLVRTQRGVFVYSTLFNGIELRREGDTTTYFNNGMKYKTYTIKEGH